MPAGDRLVKAMKKASKMSNPSTAKTDLVYGVVQNTNPLTVLVDNHLSLTSEFLILSPFCYKTSFSIKISGHKHDVQVSKIAKEDHSHSTKAVNVSAHKHQLEGKDTTEAGAQSIGGGSTGEGGGFSIQPTTTVSSAGGHQVDVTLWNDLEIGDKLVMLRVSEGQAYMILYRDKLSIGVSCQDL